MSFSLHAAALKAAGFKKPYLVGQSVFERTLALKQSTHGFSPGMQGDLVIFESRSGLSSSHQCLWALHAIILTAVSNSGHFSAHGQSYKISSLPLSFTGLVSSDEQASIC